MEQYFFEIDEQFEDKVFALVIYDITDNRRRRKLDKFLRGYGFRVQKSAFEAIIPQKTYQKLVSALPGFASDEDSIRLYRIVGKGKVMAFGKKQEVPDEDVIII